MTLSDLRAARPVGLTDGAQASRQRAADTDRALSDLLHRALGEDPKLGLIAVGGYGRRELSPHSDIDLLFVHRGHKEISSATLRNVLYPLWDAGFQIGHAVGTPKEAVERADSDIHAATSLLSARLIAGSQEAFAELIDRRDRSIAKNRRSFVRRIIESTQERHRSADRAGWTLAPDIKNDIGGLRDGNSVGWLAAVVGSVAIPEQLSTAYDLLLAVREALHAEVTRKTDRVRLDLQAPVAARLGLSGDDASDVLMGAVHSAARTIEHVGSSTIDALAEGALGGPRRSGSTRALDDKVSLRDGRIHLDGPPDRVAVLNLARAVSETGKRLDPGTAASATQALAHSSPTDWEPDTLHAFFAVLKGPHCEEALELLDHLSAWSVLLPEWSNVRGRAQHDPYHRYTVDGHSFRAVACIRTFIEQDAAAALALGEITDDRALYLATLLHDIGKGSGEDHSVAGARMTVTACRRMGLPHKVIADVEALVRHHLLLSDTATRRDIDDGSVISSVASTISDPDVLRSLYILSGADGLATGRGSWNGWKASLVFALYRRVLVALGSGEIPSRSDVDARLRELEAYDPVVAATAGPILTALPPSYLAATSVEDIADDVRLLDTPPAPGHVVTRIDPGFESGRSVVTVCFADRPGSLARTAGVLTLHRVGVLSAQAYTTDAGSALERFIVAEPEKIDWAKVESDMSAAYSGRLALDARLEQKAQAYKPKEPLEISVRILPNESEHSTVVEVRAPDALGLLYALCTAISGMDINIHVAKIDTLGERVVDVFYLRSSDGSKLDDLQSTELVTAMKHQVGRLFG
mgnify:CR=1 FL=1